MLQVPTDRGTWWFKACCDHFIAEAAIVHRLAHRIPHLVPVLAAADDEAGWMLMEPMRGASDGDRAAGAVDAAAPLWASAQVAALEWLDELRAAGCPERGLEATLKAWYAVLATSPEMALLTEAERHGCRSPPGALTRWCVSSWACGLPDTLSHGDLHPGNLAYDGNELRIFDWTDGCVTHPFLDGSHLAQVLDWYGTAEGEADRVMQAHVRPWRDAFPEADVDRALELRPAGRPRVPDRHLRPHRGGGRGRLRRLRRDRGPLHQRAARAGPLTTPADRRSAGSTVGNHRHLEWCR